MTDIAKLRILVDIDSAGVARGAAASTAAIAGFERGTTRALSRVTTAFSNLSRAQKGLIGLGSAAILVGTALSAVVGPAIEFESAFAGVEKTVEGTPGQLARIREELIGLSTTIPTTAVELAGIAENAGQLGIAANDVVAFTRTIAILAETTDLDFDSAAQSLARFINVTGDALSVDDLANVIVELGNNTATTESQILNFASRLGASLSLAGATQDEILALAAAFSSLDIQAEAGGTAVSTVFGKIADAAKLGGQELKIFADTAGLTVDEFRDLALNDPTEAFLRFNEGLRAIDESGRSITPTLEGLDLTGRRVTRTLQLAAGGSDQLREALGFAADEAVDGTAAFDEANKRFETTASRLDILQDRLRALAISLGTPALSTFAQGADTAGDAIERLVEILAPLAREGAETFSNLAEAAEIFFDIIGGPALQVAVAGLTGVAVAVAGVLEALNALGPAGAALGALLVTMALFPAQVGLAATAVGVFGLELQALGPRAAVAAAGTKAFQLALSAGPLILFTAALVALGKAWIDAGSAARESASGFREAFDEASAEGNLAAATGQVDALIERQRELRAELAGVDQKLGESAGSFFNLSRTIQGTVEILTPLENTVLNNRRELEALNRAAEELGFVNFTERLELAAQAAGVSTEAAFNLGNELGVLDDLLTGGGEGLRTFVTAINEATVEQKALSDETGIFLDKIIAGTATERDFADALGITTSELATLAAQIEGVEIEDLLDPDKATAAFDAIEALLAAYGELAGQVGLTTTQFISQIEAVDRLAASHSALRSAVDDARSALALIGEQQRITEEATEAFAEALESIGDTGGLEAAATAMRDLSLEFAASGVSASEAAAKQGELFAAFLNAADAAGVAEGKAIDVAIALGLVPDAILATITVEGQQAKTEAELVESQLEATARIYRSELTLDASGALLTRDQVFESLIDFTETEFIALLEANGIDARQVIADAKEAAEEWADAEYLAFLMANGVEAEDVIGLSRDAAIAFAAGDYTAFLKAVDNASDTIDAARGRAAGFAGVSTRFLEANDVFQSSDANAYVAVLSVEDEASAVIQNAVNVLDDFRSKTITITTIHETIGAFSGSGITSTTSSSSSSSSGGGGGGTFFQAGGFSDPPRGGRYDAGGIPDVVAQGVKASPSHSDIYTPATPYRIFAEPQVGRWEAFIAESAPIERNRAIVAEVSRRLGIMQHGGVMGLVERYQTGGITNIARSSTSFSINAPISIDLTQLPANVDLAQIEAVFTARLQQALSDLGRQIANAP